MCDITPRVCNLTQPIAQPRVATQPIAQPRVATQPISGHTAHQK